MWNKIRKNYRRWIASLLTMAMVVTNAGGNLGTIFAAGETENALFLVEGEDLRQAIREAEKQGEVFDFSSLQLAAKRKSIKNRYEKLLGKKEGAVYALELEIDDSYAPEGTELQVFYNAKTEDVIFLFLNGSDMVVDYRVNIDGYETEPVRVNPNTMNVEMDGEEAPAYAENYEAADMIDDEVKKLGAEVIGSQETSAAEEDTDSDESQKETGDAVTDPAEDESKTETEESSAAEETEETTEAEETEDAVETESDKEETEAENEAEVTEETEAEEEAEPETEAEPEEAEAEEEDSEEGELLSISRHEAAVVTVSLEELEDEAAAEEAEAEIAEEETEEETEAETEEETEAETEVSEETEADTESESKAEENETEADSENKAEETEDGTEEESKPEESKAEEEEGKTEDGGAETGADITIEETEGENGEEISDEGDSSVDVDFGSDSSAKDDGIDMDGQLLEDDDVEILGELKGKEYDTVTVLDHVNARAWKIAWEDIAAVISSEYMVDYQVNIPEAAEVKGADSVAEGEDLYFAVEPEEGYEILSVYANGMELEEVEDVSDLASASNWKGYSHVYVVEGAEEDVWVEVEMVDSMIAAKTYTKETNDAVFSVDVPDGAFKEEVELRVTKIGETELKELVEQANDALKDGQAIVEAEAYDIAFISKESGEEIEPLKPVAVDMSFKEAIASDKDEDEAAKTTKEVVVVHLPDDAEAKAVASAESADTTEFSFQADSFSVYMRALAMSSNVSLNGIPKASIQTAVNWAKDGDIITLSGDITESVTVSKNVKITIDLGENTWTGNNNIALSISKGNVEVKNGTMSAAGGYNAIKYKADKATAGTLTLNNVIFTGSTTKAGAALYLDSASLEDLTTKLTECTFSENVRAIYASKTKLTLDDCKITGNNNQKWANGAIVYLGSAETTFNNGEISDNTGVEVRIIELANGSFVMDGTTLTNNSSYGVVGTSSAANITMKNVVATGNTGMSSMNSGGSVLNANYISGKTVILENVTATDNKNTSQHGGAFYFGGGSSSSSTSIEITGCTITGNTANNQGGAIYLSNQGKTVIHDTVITGNTANSKVSKTMGYGQIGGGLFVANTTGSVTLSGSTRIYNNHTPNDKLIPGTNTHGSADMVLASTKVTSSSSAKNPDNFKHATLVLDIENPFTDEEENQHTLTQFDRKKVNSNGYYYTSGSNYYWPMGYYTSTVEPAKVYLNAADGHTGKTDIKATSLEDAVKKAQENGRDKVYVCGNTIVDGANVEYLNSGITFVRCQDHPKGHMFTIKDAVTLNHAHIDGQNAEGNAALVNVSSGVQLTITGDTVIENGNNTEGKGGGLYLSQAGLTMEGGTITNNSAKSTGGGIYAFSNIDGTKMVFEGGTISKNSSGGNGGGGVYIGAISSYFGVEGKGRTLFDSNTTSVCGGAVYIESAGAKVEHLMHRAKFTNNVSTRSMQYQDGGAIYIQSGTTVRMKNVYISGNRSTSTGAGMGGGYTALALCPTGDLAIYELDGLLAINNGPGANRLEEDMDIGWIYTGSGAGKEGIQLYLSDKAPGGGDVSYTTKSGTTIDVSEYQFHKGPFSSLNSHASEEAIQWAEEKAESVGVVITGNRASQYGTGVMTNGTLIIGTETKSVKVVKEWSDGAEAHAGDQILVYLTRDGKIVDAETRSDASVILSAANNWSYTWTNLDPDHQWSFKEASIPGYTSVLGDEVKNKEFALIADQFFIRTLTNTKTDEPSDKLVITKTAYGLDPDASYKFTLKLDNVGDKMFALQMDGTLYPIYNNEIEFYLKSGQSAIVDGLPEGFTYKVEEEKGDYYTYESELVTANEAGRIVEVARVNVNNKFEISGSKKWDDDNNRDHVRPEKIQVTLKASNGLTYPAQEVKADENGNWSWKFTDLPEYDGNGEKVIYTVSEDVVSDYSAVYPETDAELGQYDIKNVHTPGRTSRTVEKIWKDGDNRDRTRPESITVQLYEAVDGNKKAYGDAVALNQENNWSYTWNDLFVKEDGKEIVYSVEEVNVPDKYEVQVEETGTKFLITNTYNPQVVSKTVEKRWVDNEDSDKLRPASVQVRLLADGSQAEVQDAVVTLEAANEWKHTWVNLPANRDGNSISYTVEEIEVPNGYTVGVDYDGDQMIVTNTHTPENPPDKPHRPGGGGGSSNPPSGGGNTPGGPGTTTIDEPGVPLANFPPESVNEIIENSEVPLAALPRTGDSRHTKALLMMFSLAGLGMLLTAAGLKKRKDESDD